MCFGSQQTPTPSVAAVDPNAQATATSNAAANAARRKSLGLGDVTGTLLATSKPSLGSAGGSTTLGSTT